MRSIGWQAGLVAMGVVGGLIAEEVKSVSELPKKFIRMTMNPERPRIPQSLDTSIIRFVPTDEKLAKAGVTVDLIGAIHIGDQAYFQKLDKSFKQYDALLYEMVAEKDETGGAPQRWEDRDQPGTGTAQAPRKTAVSEEKSFEAGMTVIGGMQLGAKDMLGLAFQLDGINYNAPNMVHADMSPEEFAQKMKDRGESFFTMFMELFMQGLAQQRANKQGGASDGALLFAFFSSDRELALKRVLAKQFAEVDILDMLGGEKGSTIITERNLIALDVLSEQLAKGKKRIGIFYGAGHLGDMSRRLVSDFGMKFTGEKWVEAWNLRSKPRRRSRK
ncbi:MAG: hypothetical protein VYB66_08380, partial [Verrucomicrobiota bacterium]|nr:hypothetical protein [Verrucomicrobiota bacterium]